MRVRLCLSSLVSRLCRPGGSTTAMDEVALVMDSECWQWSLAVVLGLTLPACRGQLQLRAGHAANVPMQNDELVVSSLMSVILVVTFICPGEKLVHFGPPYPISLYAGSAR